MISRHHKTSNVYTGSPPAYRVLYQHRFLNNTVYFGTLICPFSTKSLLCLHGFLLTQLIFQSLKKPYKQRIPCIYIFMEVHFGKISKQNFINCDRVNFEKMNLQLLHRNIFHPIVKAAGSITVKRCK